MTEKNKSVRPINGTVLGKLIEENKKTASGLFTGGADSQVDRMIVEVAEDMPEDGSQPVAVVAKGAGIVVPIRGEEFYLVNVKSILYFE